VKFGVSYNTGAYGVVDPDAMIAVARHAEDCGFESFYVPEHIALYPGASFGAVTFPPDLPIADPLECLAFVAAATERILLGTGVLLLPYHQPVVPWRETAAARSSRYSLPRRAQTACRSRRAAGNGAR